MFRVLGIFTFAAIFAVLGYGFAILEMRSINEARRRESDDWLRKLMREDDELADPDFAGA
jgi:hypothetical protein